MSAMEFAIFTLLAIPVAVYSIALAIWFKRTPAAWPTKQSLKKQAIWIGSAMAVLGVFYDYALGLCFGLMWLLTEGTTLYAQTKKKAP